MPRFSVPAASALGAALSCHGVRLIGFPSSYVPPALAAAAEVAVRSLPLAPDGAAASYSRGVLTLSWCAAPEMPRPVWDCDPYALHMHMRVFFLRWASGLRACGVVVTGASSSEPPEESARRFRRLRRVTASLRSLSFSAESLKDGAALNEAWRLHALGSAAFLYPDGAPLSVPALEG